MPAFKSLEFASPSLSYPQARVRVDILEKDPNRAPRVCWYVGDELFYSTDSLHCYGELGYRVARTAIYSRPGLHGPLSLASTEHLAPVFLMWPNQRFNVHATELPMMDGSALPFFHALRKVAGIPEPLCFYDVPVSFDLEFPRGRVSVSPADCFEVEYEITRDATAGGAAFRSAATLSVYSAEDLYRAFSARTFIFEEDYAKARAEGLLAGVDESCGMLLGCAGEHPRYRMAEEPACHKILDLLGDLAFAVPALPKVRVQILNGGHTIHHKIMEKLLPYVSTGNPQEV